jgi:hypothetical protein
MYRCDRSRATSDITSYLTSASDRDCNPHPIPSKDVCDRRLLPSFMVEMSHKTFSDEDSNNGGAAERHQLQS